MAGKFARPRGSALVLLRTPAVGGSVRCFALHITLSIDYNCFDALYCTHLQARAVVLSALLVEMLSDSLATPLAAAPEASASDHSTYRHAPTAAHLACVARRHPFLVRCATLHCRRALPTPWARTREGSSSRRAATRNGCPT